MKREFAELKQKVGPMLGERGGGEKDQDNQDSSGPNSAPLFQIQTPTGPNPDPSPLPRSLRIPSRLAGRHHLHHQPAPTWSALPTWPVAWLVPKSQHHSIMTWPPNFVGGNLSMSNHPHNLGQKFTKYMLSEVDF